MDILWEDLRCLEAVDRTRSVAAAARELGLSASTVYRRIAALEVAIGQSCIVRGPGDAVLTDAGTALARVGKQTRKGIAEVDGALRAKDSAIAGEVSLTAVESMAPFLGPMIAELTQRFPLRISLYLGDSGPSVRDREVDVAIGIMKRPPAGCWGRKLCKLPYGVYATSAALAETPRRWVVRERAERASPESAWEREHATPVAASAKFDATVGLVLAGVGLGLMPRLIASPHPSLVEVTEFRESVRSLERTAWLLTHPDLRRVPRVATLMSAIQEAFRSES